MMAMPKSPFIVVALTVIILVSAFLLASGDANAAVSVKPGESIQAAIGAATPGDTIDVYSGTYNENLKINKRLTLKGIDSGGGRPLVNVEDGSAITLLAGGITLEGFQAATASSWGNDAGIEVLSNRNTIRDNVASGSGNAGMVFIEARNNTIIGNVANGNHNDGISLRNCSNNILKGNTVSQNRYGIKLTDSQSNEISGNVVMGNKFDGIYLENSLRNLIEGNYAISNWAGVSLDGSKDNVIRKNDVIGNEKGIYLTYQNMSNDIQSHGKGVYITYGDQFSKSDKSTNNTIYMNNLSNTNNAYDDSYNRWNYGKLGNNYSDFNEPEEGCIGGKTCNSEYKISGGSSVDKYPLVIAAKPKPIIKSAGLEGSDMRIERRNFAPGSEIDVNFTAPKDHEAWAGLASGNQTQGEQYIGQNTSGTLIFAAPKEEGAYHLKMYSKDGMVFLSLPFNVMSSHIAASPSATGTCEKILVSYSGAPGNDRDSIGMYPAGSSDTAISRQYLKGSENGTLTFSTPNAGSYNFRMFGAGSSKPLCVSNAVNVKAESGIKVVAEPSQVAPGGTVTVTFWGAPPAGTGVIGMYEVTRPDKFHIEKKPIGARSCGSITFQVPAAPGRYDFRMFGDDINRPILGQSNIVNVV